MEEQDTRKLLRGIKPVPSRIEHLKLNENSDQTRCEQSRSRILTTAISSTSTTASKSNEPQNQCEEIYCVYCKANFQTQDYKNHLESIEHKEQKKSNITRRKDMERMLRKGRQFCNVLEGNVPSKKSKPMGKTDDSTQQNKCIDCHSTGLYYMKYIII